MKYEHSEPDPQRIKKPTATIIRFPQHRIRRIILRGNKVYDPPGPRYHHWDEPA